MPSKTTISNLPSTSRIRADASQAVRRTALAIQARARIAAPVDTGFLRKSIQIERLGDLTSVVFVAAEYGVYVELGTVHSPAQPYFLPAVAAEEPGFNAVMKAIIER